jgi:hypothetical protein
MAIVGSAFVEEGLKRLLKALWTGQKPDTEFAKLVSAQFEYPAALSSFSAVTSVAYCAGIIGRKTYTDLKAIRDVRNLFAHKMRPSNDDNPMSFDDEMIAVECNKLTTCQDKYAVYPEEALTIPFTTPRNRFFVTVNFLGQDLHWLADFLAYGKLAEEPRHFLP